LGFGEEALANGAIAAGISKVKDNGRFNAQWRFYGSGSLTLLRLGGIRPPYTDGPEMTALTHLMLFATFDERAQMFSDVRPSGVRLP